jgi:hypothetical protein
MKRDGYRDKAQKKRSNNSRVQPSTKKKKEKNRADLNQQKGYTRAI